MTKGELKWLLRDYDDDVEVVHTDGRGWANIQCLVEGDHPGPGESIALMIETNPVFSES